MKQIQGMLSLITGSKTRVLIRDTAYKLAIPYLNAKKAKYRFVNATLNTDNEITELYIFPKSLHA